MNEFKILKIQSASMKLETYIDRLDTFISRLPDSEMKILMFVENEQTPYINVRAKKWDIDGDPLYIIPKAKGYCDVYLDLTMMTYLTIGLSINQPSGKMLLETRLTAFIPDTKQPTIFYYDSLVCNVFLTDTLEKTTDCIQLEKARGQKLEMYDDEDTHILPILQSIHSILWNSGMMGNHGSFNPSVCGFDDSDVERIKGMLLDNVNSEKIMVVGDGNNPWMIRYLFRDIDDDRRLEERRVVKRTK